jgi:CPA1 family monovalent cation:H+ antiporter
MSAAALLAIDQTVAAEGAPAQWAQPLKAEIGDRVALESSDSSELTPRMEFVNRLRHAVILAERRELIRLWRAGEIGDEVMHHLMEILDYEQAHLPAVGPGVPAANNGLTTVPAGD